MTISKYKKNASVSIEFVYGILAVSVVMFIVLGVFSSNVNMMTSSSRIQNMYSSKASNTSSNNIISKTNFDSYGKKSEFAAVTCPVEPTGTNSSSGTSTGAGTATIIGGNTSGGGTGIGGSTGGSATGTGTTTGTGSSSGTGAGTSTGGSTGTGIGIGIGITTIPIEGHYGNYCQEGWSCSAIK